MLSVLGQIRKAGGGGGGGGEGGGAVHFRSDTNSWGGGGNWCQRAMGGDRCQNSRPLFNDGGGVVKCSKLLHKSSTISIPYQSLFHTIGYYYS